MESTISLITFCIFLVIFLGIGSWAARRTKDSDEDYLLGSRSFGRVAVGLSAGATGNSGFIMIGGVGMAYVMGISAIWLTLGAFLGEWTFWTFFSKRVSKFSQDNNSYTVPEMLGASVNTPIGRKRITQLVALISVILVGAYAAAQFSAAGKALNVFFDLTPAIGAIIAAAAILSYCVVGGLRASIWTDLVQAAVVMTVTYGMCTWAIITAGGPSQIIPALQSIDPALADPMAGFTPWAFAAYLFGFFALGLGFDLSNPQVLVRLLAGKSPEEVRTARWVYLGYVYTTWGAMVLFGIVCRVLIPEIGDPEQALPTVAMQNYAPWLVGIVLAGLFSVIASTADSQILVCSSAVARDMFPSFYRRMSARFGVKYQHAVTLFVGIAAVTLTLTVATSVFTLIMFAIGALAGSIGSAMLIVLLGRRTNSFALITTMTIGLIAAVGWRMLGLHEVLNESAPGIIVGLLVHEVIMAFVPVAKQQIPQGKIIAMGQQEQPELKRVENI